MKELKNLVTVTGKLVKNNIEEFTTAKGEDAIGGNLVLRTSDNSEHEINFFSFKYKRDKDKNFTTEEAYFYKQYMNAKDTLKDIEHCSEGEKPDIISITDGSFTANDFKGKDEKVVSSNKILARFINKVEPKDYDSTVLEAKFEVEGIIATIKDEIVKDISTGNLVVSIMAIRQFADNYGKDAKYTADSLIPIKMVVDKSMAIPFRSAGYYEGCFTKLAGKVVNSVEIVKQVEKVAFGEDIKTEIKSYIRKNEIKSGTTPSTIFEHELTEEIIEALKAKRKATLAEIASGQIKQSENLPFKPDTSTPAPATTYNPFAANN